MNEDQLYLLVLYLIWAILFIVLIYRSVSKLKTFFLHSITGLVYSIYFAYNLKYNGASGTSLAWLIYWMIIIGLHSFGFLVLIIYSLFKKKNILSL